MQTPTTAQLRALTAPETLLRLMPPDDNLLFGFEVHPDGLAVHVRPLDIDQGPGATALFGRRVPREWDAVGVVAVGRLRRLGLDGHAEEILYEESAVSIAMHRDRRFATRLHLDGIEVDPARLDSADGRDVHPTETAASGPHGLLLDALARVLGVPCPGEPPPPTLLSLHLWADEITARLRRGEPVDRATLVELHPSGLGEHCSPALVSAEGLIDATYRSTEGFDWRAFRDRHGERRHAATGLDDASAAWMDPTMYGRWMLGAFEAPLSALHLLQAHDPVAARLFDEVIDGVVAGW